MVLLIVLFFFFFKYPVYLSDTRTRRVNPEKYKTCCEMKSKVAIYIIYLVSTYTLYRPIRYTYITRIYIYH